MSDQLRRRAARRARQAPTAYGLLMRYERAIADAVEATLDEGLRLSRAGVQARARAAAAWRDALTFVAAEHLSNLLGEQAAHSDRASFSSSSLRHALRPYATLVANAARAEMAREPETIVAAD
jgi:hypothetical protein